MKLAILGTGFIVKEGALPALREVPEVEVMAIFARERSRSVAEGLAVQYGIPRVYTDYDELLASQDVEFVYVGLTNSVHYEYAKKALLAGKHVIMEKLAELGKITAVMAKLNRYPHRMVHEFQEFAALYAAQDYAAMEAGLKVSQVVMETAERARKDAGIVFGCDRQR